MAESFQMDWNTDPARTSPVFEPLRVHGGGVLDTAWPDVADFQSLLDRRNPLVRVASGELLRIVGQGRKPAAFEEKYEVRLFLRGELQVRRGHWHDYFNVLVWLAFPRSKAALNARHYSELVAQRAAGAPNRGPVQDALTLFDEGGVIVACDDDELILMLEAFRWKDLFWENRERLYSHMRFWIFGHALYEKALRPFIGITGRGIVLKTAPGLFAAPPREQLAVIDAKVAAYLSDPARLAATRELAVVPVLGVPGWCAGNEREEFYDDRDYFRPGRLKEMRDK